MSVHILVSHHGTTDVAETAVRYSNVDFGQQPATAVEYYFLTDNIWSVVMGVLRPLVIVLIHK